MSQMPDERYNLTFFVNDKVTCILENLPEHEIYAQGIPSEGGRWKVHTRVFLRRMMTVISRGKMMLLAYQTPPLNTELDTEKIYISKN